ncbi:DoxX family protein [Vulgatibacter sp.]|uniref:DoxX family protein n=1 Tax=Vulgatibacter sp. TaxID=1971226 RepID=UPI0035675B58
MESLLRTDARNTALLVQRLVLALVILPHGAQKLLGWFGGYGFTGTMDFFTGTVGLPTPVAALVILFESVGAVLLAAGLFSRLAAAGIAAVMAGAALTTHLPYGFFMNWFGNQKGEGFEFHLLALALAIPLAIWGGGRASADARLATGLATGTVAVRNAAG